MSILHAQNNVVCCSNDEKGSATSTTSTFTFEVGLERWYKQTLISGLKGSLDLLVGVQQKEGTHA